VNAIFLTLFVSLVLVIGAGLLFGFVFHERTHEHADRLALLPLDDEPAASSQKGIAP
jgi:hypothetical protein